MSDPYPCNLCKRPLPNTAYPTYITDKGERRYKHVCRECRSLQKAVCHARNIKKERRRHAINQKRRRALNPAGKAYDTAYQRQRRDKIRADAIKAFADRGMYPVDEILKRHAVGSGWLKELLRRGIIHGELWRRHWYVLESSLKAYFYE